MGTNSFKEIDYAKFANMDNNGNKCYTYYQDIQKKDENKLPCEILQEKVAELIRLKTNGDIDNYKRLFTETAIYASNHFALFGDIEKGTKMVENMISN